MPKANKFFLSKRSLCVVGAFSAAFFLPQAWATEPEIYPLERLRPGQIAEMSTVLQGSEPETIEVEILGVRENGIGPGVDMIVGRLLGEVGEWKGVAAGMSGSPVSIDGKLLGALSYSIGSLAKEPICGITPIEAMLDLENYPRGPLPWRAAASFEPIPLALTGSGFDESVLEGFLDSWAGVPLTWVDSSSLSSSGSIIGGKQAATTLQPGQPVSALLIWGDLRLGATGTVTWREGDRLLAFGHPFFGSGRASFPMAPAQILWTIPSLLSSFKLSVIGEPVGTVVQDRLPAVMGEVGSLPRSIEVGITLERWSLPVGETNDAPAAEQVKTSRSRYFVLDDPFLAPGLSAAALQMRILQGTGAEQNEAMSMNGRLMLSDGQEVPFGAAAAGGGGGPPAVVLGQELMMRMTEFSRPHIDLPRVERVEIDVRAFEPEGGWMVTRAHLDRLVASPGETFRVYLQLSGTRGRMQRQRLELTVPEDLRPGKYRVIVGSAREAAAQLGTTWEARRRTARDASEYIEAVSSIPRNDHLAAYLVLVAEGIITEGRRYPALPGTAHKMLRGRAGDGRAYRSRYLELASQMVPLERAVIGVKTLALEIVSEEKDR